MVGLKHSYLTAITYKECGNNIMSDACRMILNFEQDYLSPIALIIIIIREQASIILFLL